MKKEFSKNLFILFLLIITIIFSVFFSTQIVVQATNLPVQSDFECYKYEGEIPHFFTHQIINNPKKAFTLRLAHHYDKDCITHNEFYNFLCVMYKNNYCLVDIYDVVGYKDGVPYFKDLFVPLGKKPFLLSFDDMSYDSRGLGLSDKIILDENNNFASYTKTNDPQIEYDKEAFPILEAFIENHPDFSFHNARAIICPTGYNGILGYRINKDGINREKEIEMIKPLVKKLKDLNYHFASHTYGHIQVAYSSDNMLYQDCKKYQDEILSVIGETDLFCFPCGSMITKGSKLNILKNFGYKIFFCVGDAKTQEKNNSVFFKREVLNGIALRNYRSQYAKFFDTKLVYDHDNRTIPFPN